MNVVLPRHNGLASGLSIPIPVKKKPYLQVLIARMQLGLDIVALMGKGT
jgi:hypothetical protein